MTVILHIVYLEFFQTPFWKLDLFLSSGVSLERFLLRPIRKSFCPMLILLNHEAQHRFNVFPVNERILMFHLFLSEQFVFYFTTIRNHSFHGCICSPLELLLRLLIHLSLGVKEPKHEGDHSAPYSANVMSGTMLPLPLTSLWHGA